MTIGGNKREFMEWSTSVSHLQQWTQSARLIDWVLERIKLMQVCCSSRHTPTPTHTPTHTHTHTHTHTNTHMSLYARSASSVYVLTLATLAIACSRPFM
jgi:carbohydrate-binding DOMON domain-containing protein